MKKVILISTLYLFFGVLLQANTDKQIKHTLLKYNYGIIKMAKTSETDFFKSFLDEKIVTKLMLWVKAWHDNNLVMLANINDLRFSPIIYNENNATIETQENWSFSYIDISTRKEAHKSETIFYKMRYTLAQSDGKWKIIKINHLSEKKFVPFNSKKYEEKEKNTL